MHHSVDRVTLAAQIDSYRMQPGWRISGLHADLPARVFVRVAPRRFTMQGTHAGTLFGIPATGKPIRVGAMVFARFDERGKWVEDCANWDQLGLMQQLGVVPEPLHAA